MPKPTLTFLGNESQAGTYVLRINVERAVRMSFGRFKGGQEFDVPAGDHLYVGSALAMVGAACLAHRLLRHASRLCGQHHPIRGLMLSKFACVGLGRGLRLNEITKGALHWNIDWLLELDFAHLVGAYVIRHPFRIEAEVGRLVQSLSGAVIYAPGAGANDIPGNTHLVHIERGKLRWPEFPGMLTQLVSAAT